MSHCTAAGNVPLVVRETLSVTVAPGAPEAAESPRDAVCAVARSTAKAAIKRKRYLPKVCLHFSCIGLAILGRRKLAEPDLLCFLSF